MKKSTSIYAVVILLLILGGLITPHFGESWDELQFYKYAGQALSAYHSWPTQGTIATYGNTYDDYGPAFVMLTTLAAKPLQIIFTESDARHYIYFITFLAGVWAFYELAKRWLSPNTAVFSTLLFATQPLLFGHAFISPKDMPFLAFFLLTLHFGLKLFDSFDARQFQELDPQAGRTLGLRFGLLLLAVFGLFLFTDALHTMLTNLVQSAKEGETNIIAYIASDLAKTDASVYVQRYWVFFLWTRALILYALAFLFLRYVRALQPAIFRMLGKVFLPAVLLGFTTSIRVLGPFAAVFVAIHAFRRLGRGALIPLSMYTIIAIATMYATWPYLWANPLGHLIEGVRVMSAYPWNGQVLFNGAYYAPTSLPPMYLPVLFAIQFTEPVWPLILLGTAAALLGSREKRELLILTSIWFLIPCIGFIVTRAPLYDNFRQIFFIVPPLFILAGMVFEKIKNPQWQIALMALCLLPGIVDGIRLHPYEYIYYNRFIGGVRGAFRKFEMDYWGTSYREAARDLNRLAPPNATVWVDGPAHIFELYQREDLKVYSDAEAARADHYDYIVSTSRYNLDQTSYPDAQIIESIERDGAILTVIKAQ